VEAFFTLLKEFTGDSNALESFPDFQMKLGGAVEEAEAEYRSLVTTVRDLAARVERLEKPRRQNEQ